MMEREGYILPLKLDDTPLPGLPPVVGYIDYRQTDEDDIYHHLLVKIGSPNHDGLIIRLSSTDQVIARAILKACFTRAIFTRMASEISLEAMVKSIRNSISQVQPLLPDILDPAFGLNARQIWISLDGIERILMFSGKQISISLTPDEVRDIDTYKRTILRHLMEIRRAADIPLHLPYTLGYDHFFCAEDADQTPQPDSMY